MAGKPMAERQRDKAVVERKGRGADEPVRRVGKAGRRTVVLMTGRWAEY